MESGSYSVAPLNLLVVVLVFGLLLLWSELWRKPVVRAAARGPRSLKPKTRADCPLCQAEQGAIVDEGMAALLRPWREGQTRRGRKKRSMTAGYACDNAQCEYYGITDPAIHALVADGHQWEIRTDPGLEMPGVRPQVHRAPPYGALPAEDSFRAGGGGVDVPGERGRCLGFGTGLADGRGDLAELVDPRRFACRETPCAFLSRSPV
jgi:hypothetical protein